MFPFTRNILNYLRLTEDTAYIFPRMYGDKFDTEVIKNPKMHEINKLNRANPHTSDVLKFVYHIHSGSLYVFPTGTAVHHAHVQDRVVQDKDWRNMLIGYLHKDDQDHYCQSKTQKELDSDPIGVPFRKLINHPSVGMLKGKWRVAVCA